MLKPDNRIIGLNSSMRLIAALSILVGGAAFTPKPHLPTTVKMAAEKADTCVSPMKLFDMPVSNNGGRVRMVIYYKGLEDSVKIVAPSELGGLKSPEYTALNPQVRLR